MSDEETAKELRSLVELVGKLSSNHRECLVRHEANLQAAHATVVSHSEAIHELQRVFHEIGEHMVAQDRVVATLQENMLKV